MRMVCRIEGFGSTDVNNEHRPESTRRDEAPVADQSITARKSHQGKWRYQPHGILLRDRHTSRYGDIDYK